MINNYEEALAYVAQYLSLTEGQVNELRYGEGPTLVECMVGATNRMVTATEDMRRVRMSVLNNMHS